MDRLLWEALEGMTRQMGRNHKGLDLGLMLVRSNLRNPGYHGSLLKETAPCTSLLKDWPCAGTDAYSVLSKSSGPRLGSGLQSTLAGKDELVQ